MISREFGDLRNVAEALSYLAEMARIAGDYDAAQGLLDECLTVSRAIGGWSTAITPHYLGMVEYARGNHARARSTFLAILRGYREFGDRAGAAAALMHIAWESQLMGEIPAATSWLRQAWDWLPGGNDNELLWWLDHFAGLFVDHERSADAVRVWAASHVTGTSATSCGRT